MFVDGLVVRSINWSNLELIEISARVSKHASLKAWAGE
jgi:hypothetical protein